MPLYDYECKRCGHITEIIRPVDDVIIGCPKCNNGVATRIISASGVNCANEDAAWIRSVREVVEKGTNKPHCVEFLKNPTRSTLKNWMKGEGLRHKEDGEDRRPSKSETTEEHRKITQLLKKKKEREKIVVRG